MPDVNLSLGARLRGLRKERALSQRELADLAALSPNAISLIERDEISPSVATLQRLAVALGVKMSYFFESATVARILHFRPNQRPVIRGAGLTIEGLGARLDRPTNGTILYYPDSPRRYGHRASGAHGP